MAYTPELDRAASGLVRRIAWAAGRPMTEILEEIVLHAAQSVDPEKVCRACLDTSRCAQCYFKTLPEAAVGKFAHLFKLS